MRKTPFSLNQHLSNTHLRRTMLGTLLAMSSVWASAPAQAADHVVIMTISTYASAPLAGVVHDTRNALQLAEKLGYDTRNATILKDQELNAQGMRAALAQLAGRLQVNDRLFFYYSGHGTSSLVGNQCVSSLVAHDEAFIPTAEIKTYFDQMKGKVQDAFIVMDACFSGGHRELVNAATRSSGAVSHSATKGVAAKAWLPKTGEVCDQPTNTSKAWQVPPVSARGLGHLTENNFTFMAAASERQVALDDAARGGLATVSLLQCATDGIPTNGLATPAQLAACAQKLVDVQVPQLNARYGGRWTSHTLEVAGNTHRPLDSIKTRPPAQPTGSSSRAEQVTAALRQIATSGTNGNWAFHVTPTATTVRLAEPDQRRVVRFPYVSSQAGYGYVLYVGTDGKDMKQLFPEPGENNFLPAKGDFPALSIDPPAGNNTYLFVISQTPRDFDGIFKVGGTGSGIEDTTAVQCELTKRNSNRVKVGNPCDETRNSGRVRPEPVTGGMLEGYAAQMIVVSGK